MGFQILRAIAQMCLDQPCPLCDRPTPEALCPSCWRQVARCAVPQAAQREGNGLPVLAWGTYQQQLKTALTALKYNGHQSLAEPLGRALGQHWQRFPIISRRQPRVVPIPLHPEKLQARGFNQAALLAAAFCRQTGLPWATAGLVRQRATLPQFGLGAAERQENLAGAFSLGKDFCDRRPTEPVLLLDDIYTTGTTVRAAADTLRRHGISVCGVVAIARAAASPQGGRDEFYKRLGHGVEYRVGR
jgi:ComF family protein